MRQVSSSGSAGKPRGAVHATPASPAPLLLPTPPRRNPLRRQLYTSGSTGKPKGVVHTTAGYMAGAAATYKYVFDHR